jgi:hypothetical protein
VIGEVDGKADEMCIQFQHLLDGTEKIMTEYESLLDLVDLLQEKVLDLESSPWRVILKTFEE